MLVDGEREIPGDVKILTDSFRSTLAWLEANGFKTVFVAPPPQNGRDTGLCVARTRLLGQSAERCKLRLKDVQIHDKDILHVIADMADEYPVVSFMDYLCDEDSCKVEDQGVALYEDHGHFSAQGSRQIGRSFNFYRAFVDAALSDDLISKWTAPTRSFPQAGL